MRPTWKGNISFGLVNIPIGLVGATEERSVRFNQIHTGCGARVRQKRVCEREGVEVDGKQIARGYEVGAGCYVEIADTELDAIPVRSIRAIEILQFVALQEIDPIGFQRSYYIVPDEAGAKAYRLLRDTLEDAACAGIAKVAFRGKEHLAAIRLCGQALVLETMFWPDEIRVPSFPALESMPELSDQERSMARMLVDSLTSAWDPSRYRDEYRDAVTELIANKQAGLPVPIAEPEEKAPVIDLVAALAASIPQTKAGDPAAERTAS